MKVLTVGNSFSQNACRYLGDLAKAGGRSIVLGHADIGGCPFDKHVALARIAESSPDDPSGRPYGEAWPVIPGRDVGRRSLREALTLEEWDVVTIQQYSWISDDYSTYQPYARELREYIDRYAPQAEVVVHQTWEYRCDDPRYTSGDDSQERMYFRLREAYRMLADDLGLRLIPVGDALHAADTDADWGYRPPSVIPGYPELPDQTHSLHSGWYWAEDDRGGHELRMDGHHASALGCYLAGCVWYRFLFGEPVSDDSFVPPEIAPSDAAYLRSVAARIP